MSTTLYSYSSIIASSILRTFTSNSESPQHPPSVAVFSSHLGTSIPKKKLKARLSRLRVNAKQDPKGKFSISFGDQLLDYIEGGPKLRKWYGAPDQLPVDGGYPDEDPEDQEEEEATGVGEEGSASSAVRDAVLVTDGDSETGQLVVLQLILRRVRVRTLVRDARAATAAFGPYVEPVVGSVDKAASVDAALRGVRAIICPTKIGVVAERAKRVGVEHIVLLSQINGGGGGAFGALFGGAQKQSKKDETAVGASGLAHTIVRVGKLRDAPGGQRLQIAQENSQGAASTGTGGITREDAAAVCVRALDSPPKSALIFEVANGEEGSLDWTSLLSSLQET